MADGTRTNEQIRTDIAAARARLSSNVEGLITQAHPKAVTARTIQDAKGFLSSEATAAKEQFVDAEGRPNVTRLASLGVALAASVAFLIVVRSLVRG